MIKYFFAGPRGPDPAQRARHELRGHREGHRGAGREGEEEPAGGGGHGRRHLHHLQRRRLRLPLWHPDHQPAAVRHPRDARVLREARRQKWTGM